MGGQMINEEDDWKNDNSPSMHWGSLPSHMICVLNTGEVTKNHTYKTDWDALHSHSSFKQKNITLSIPRHYNGEARKIYLFLSPGLASSNKNIAKNFFWRKYPPPSEIMPLCPALMGLGRRMWHCFCICICGSQEFFMLQHESCICDIVAAVTLRCSKTQNNPNVVLQHGIMIWK